MRHRRAVLPALALALASAAMAQTPSQEIENVAAFARLYGVARYFYPSDAAATLDWNNFAVHGVGQVRRAATPQALERALEALFTPLGPGIEIAPTLAVRQQGGSPDASLVAWRYRGAGMSTTGGAYRWKRTNRAESTTSETAVLLQSLAADTLRGKTIRLRGRMRVQDRSAPGWTGLWLRVDRDQRQVGFFDNMQSRPVRDTAWREYVIEGPIAADATQIVFGALAVGSTTADVDALDLTVRSGSGEWVSLAISDPGFEAESSSGTRWLPASSESFARRTEGAAEGQRFLRITKSPAKSSPPTDPFEIPLSGAFVDVQLTPRLKARVPLSLTSADASATQPSFAAISSAVSALATTGVMSGADVRLADVVVAWNVFRHFYPYWAETGVDWDARLRPQLEVAQRAEGGREAHRDALRALVADARDGHGGVYDAARRPGTLPIRVRIIEGKPVVTGSATLEVGVGGVVTAIDGASAADRVATEARLASGTPQWRQARAAGDLIACTNGSSVKVRLQYPLEQEREAVLTCRSMRPPTEQRPDSIKELEPGIWYVDLTRATEATVRPMLAKLASARGVVFDVRGYPTDAGFMLLPHLISAPENARWMHVSRIAKPFGQVEGWDSFGWDVRPAEPRVAANRVFLTDGGAISYAESVMGYIRDEKLATIIGGTTAGTNGNVANFRVPSGYSIAFTGMRVTRHDGRSPYHMEGVKPDIAVEPTLTGVRAGRDEVLERALALLRGIM